MITLVLGGTRSGKSAVAELLAAAAGAATNRPVTYVATAAVDPADADHRARIAAHRARRPASWTTIECHHPDDLVAALQPGPDTEPAPVLVDSLGTWVTRHPDLTADPAPLVAALTARAARLAPTVLVTEEVGLAVHPSTELGRRYVDALGLVNQAVAAVATRALLVVAGRALELGPPPAGSGPGR